MVSQLIDPTSIEQRIHRFLDRKQKRFGLASGLDNEAWQIKRNTVTDTDDEDITTIQGLVNAF